jgi:hypothetical protein
MPSYESNQTVSAHIRRLCGTFGGFTAQSAEAGSEIIQIVRGKIEYRGTRIFVAVFSQKGKTQDAVILSIPLFRVSDGGSEQLYEQLLSWNNGATESARFAFDEALQSINVVCVRPVEGLGFDEFRSCADNTVSVATKSIGKLQKWPGLERIN